MEATSFACPKQLPGRRFLAKPPHRRILIVPMKKIVSASRDMNRRDYSGRLVDESMIVLRLRLREMKMSEMNHTPPLDWMEWEKRYYAHYNEDVCEAEMAKGVLSGFHLLLI
ncbi:hypothetical protein F0562_005438 [Nyssa sinensis]|uniref:Uncharacterized protein n=1 Tax=Nyssa sinensis TaxID=561372 RepID=A0A5J5AK85_9ASTE|nr:hypothetical protein F0562_005438 [Nyssa sinensis]